MYNAQNNKILIPNIKVYAVVLKFYCRSNHFGFQIFLQFLSGIVLVRLLYKPKMLHKHKTKGTEFQVVATRASTHVDVRVATT